MIALPAAAPAVARCEAASPIALRENVTIDRALVALGDVADLSALPAPLRARAAAIGIVRLPAGRGAGRLSGATIATRVRAAMPLLGCALAPVPGAASVAVTYKLAETPGPAPFAPTAPVKPHDRLSLVTSSGPVRVARQVEALQTAAPGDRLFVRSEDGQIFSARYAADVR